MPGVNSKTFIIGLHVYKIEKVPGDILKCKLDNFWMGENPSRYSIACEDSKHRVVGHIAKEHENVLGMMLEFGKKELIVIIPDEAVKTNAGELGVQIGM